MGMNCKIFWLIYKATQYSLETENNENIQETPSLFLSKQMLSNVPDPITLKKLSLRVKRLRNQREWVNF